MMKITIKWVTASLSRGFYSLLAEDKPRSSLDKAIIKLAEEKFSEE